MNIRSINRQALLLATKLIAIAVSVCPAQTPVAGQPNELVPETQFKLVGVKECAACHSHPSPIYEQLQVTSFIRLVEAKEWLDRDRHSMAYKIVRPENNPLTLRICENLGWKPNGPEFVTQCLTCHAGVDHLQPSLDEATLRFGVQCEACHGAGSEWTKVEHHQQTSWRKKSTDEKLKLGMKDLMAPSVCAEVCFSCHIGNIQQNRFVTHAMYAAGHPPLPPVELQSFLDAMPPHWKTLAEKPLTPAQGVDAPKQFELQNEYYRAHFGDSASSPQAQSAIRTSYRRSQTSLIGGLVAHKVGLELIRDAAERDSLWGDYALYDCAGCHHELIKPSTRVLPVGRTPGRPYPAGWWNLNIEQLSNRNVSPFRATPKILEAFDKTPFGQRETVAETLTQIFADRRAWEDEWKNAEQRPMTDAQARAWLRTIVDTRLDSMSDFWTARQTGWMVEVVVKELVEKERMPEEPTETLLAELSDELQLTLKRSQKQPVVDSLKATLDRARSFDATRCRKIMRQLLELSS